MAKVSIIIPTYNVEMYLVECMDSVVNQTLKDIEIICINDGSTDSSLEILKSYAEKDDRIVIVDKENEGYGIGMNIGLDKATGEYIGIVEPDDFVPLNMYEELYEIAKEHDLDLVKADFYRFKRDSESSDMQLVYNHLSRNPDDYNTVLNLSETPNAIRFIMNTWSGIYKRSFIEEHHIRHNTTPGASFQDNGFWFQTFIYAKRGMFIDKPYYMNRRDNPNSSVNSPAKVYCINVEYDHIKEILLRDPEIWERFRPVYWLKRYHNTMVTLGRIANHFKKEYIINFSTELKRGMEKHELEQSAFTNNEWANIQHILKDPVDFYLIKYGHGENEKRLNDELNRLRREMGDVRAEADRSRRELEDVRRELDGARRELDDARQKLVDVKKTKTFRLGEILLFIPRKIKLAIKGEN